MIQDMRFPLCLAFALMASCSGNDFRGTSSKQSKSVSNQGGPPVAAVSADSSADSSAKPSTASTGPSCIPLPQAPPQIDPVDREKVGTVRWEGTEGKVVTLQANSLAYTTSSEASDGYQVYSNELPPVTAQGWHLDVELSKGFFYNPSEGSDPSENYVAWLGVTNSTQKFTWHNASENRFTGWYWSGTVWSPPSVSTRISECTHEVLDKGLYRVAMRLESGVPKIYFRKSGKHPHGPYAVPEGQLRLMMLPQSGSKFPAAAVKNSGDVYKGGGGLF